MALAMPAMNCSCAWYALSSDVVLLGVCLAAWGLARRQNKGGLALLFFEREVVDLLHEGLLDLASDEF